MTKTEIIGAIMLLTGKRVDKYAKDAGLPQAVVYRVINGTSKNERVRAAISEAIGKPISEIWPETTKEKADV